MTPYIYRLFMMYQSLKLKTIMHEDALYVNNLYII